MKHLRPLRRVRKTMNKKRLNLTALSFYSGIELSRLSRMLNGWLIPSERDQERISTALDLPKNHLFEERKK